MFEKYDKNNIFAKIIRGEVPAKKVFEDEKTLAFYDIHPKAAVHILVIPKGEYLHFSDFCTKASQDKIVHFWKIVSQIADKYTADFGGFKLITNNNAGGGQEVPHFHVHIISG
jgi:diadenosine tetraphosphate (Ap4A) HIT family hydrolase